MPRGGIDQKDNGHEKVKVSPIVGPTDCSLVINPPRTSHCCKFHFHGLVSDAAPRRSSGRMLLEARDPRYAVVSSNLNILR